MNGHIECLKILVEANADLDVEDKSNSTPLHHAVRNGNKTCASFLLKVFIELIDANIVRKGPKWMFKMTEE
jgi:ankyrin repeat protein